LAAVYGPGRRLRQHPFQHPPIAPCVEDQRGAITPEFVADYGLRFHRTLTDAEAALDDGTCGACANCGPGSLIASEQVTVSAINRNFPGRSGPGQVWLASPPTVAASAIAGTLMSFEELRARKAA
jgi:hypothetical protein